MPDARSLEALCVEQGTFVGKLEMNSAQHVTARRARLGLNDPTVARFRDQCEFIGLGCNCCISFALQALDVKDFSYPLDWVRSPIQGVIQLIESDFEDFFEYSFTKPQDNYPIDMYGGTSWGGSFLHHRVDDPKCRQDFERRIDRFYGRLSEVPPSKSRVFVRLVNSSSELSWCKRLYKVLCNVFPEARVFLLILVDLQPMQGPIMLDDGVGGEDVMYYMISATNYNNPNRSLEDQNILNSEAYAAALAEAMEIWSGCDPDHHVETLSSVSELEAICQPFWAGDPAKDMYSPTALQMARKTNDEFLDRERSGALSQGSTLSPRGSVTWGSSAFSADDRDVEEHSDHEESCQCGFLSWPLSNGYKLLQKQRRAKIAC
jgi:hypothetical protein